LRLVDAITGSDGLIVLDPGAETVDGEVAVRATVDPAVFETLWPDIANAPVPLDGPVYDALRSIDRFWAANAERWRAEGRI